MDEIRDSIKRIGNFTSSQIAALMTNGKEKDSFGKPALTYIKQKKRERRLGRSIDNDSNARPLTWGKMVEAIAFEQLGTSYGLYSNKTLVHPTIGRWSGSPDGVNHSEPKAVIDLKCPITLNSFCDFADCNTIEDIRANHTSGDTYFWQLVSNAIISCLDYAELIVYCPYKSELEAIKDMCSPNSLDREDAHKYAWIYYASDDELPWIPDGGHYKNINIFRFQVPQSDKDALTERVLRAINLLDK